MSVLGATFWGWLVVGFALLALELLAPLTYFLWLGASAMVTALVSFVVPEISWQVQFLVFSVLSVTSIIISRKFLVPGIFPPAPSIGSTMTAANSLRC